MTLPPPGARETIVSAVGGRWRVLEGERPLGHEPAGLDVTPILLIHGGGYDAAAISWFRLIGPLSAQRRVIAPDLPGCGGTTEVPLPGAPSAAADQLVALLDALGVDRVVACGVSMGGDIALELALRHPTRLAGLVCIAPGGLMPSFGSAAMQRLMWLTTRANDRGMALISRLSRPFLRESCATWCTTRPRCRPKPSPRSSPRPGARMAAWPTAPTTGRRSARAPC